MSRKTEEREKREEWEGREESIVRRNREERGKGKSKWGKEGKRDKGRS